MIDPKNLFRPRPALLALCLLLLAPYTLHAAPLLVPNPPNIAAKGYLLLDANSGHILASKRTDKRLEPASLTKLMTAYILFTELRSGTVLLEDKIKISEKAWRMGGSKMFIEAGKFVTVQDLIKGMIIQSGNDATVALAEHIAGSEEAFATLMNNYAFTLGMKNTNFVNSTGMPHRKHYTTIDDLATLSLALIHDFPEYYK